MKKPFAVALMLVFPAPLVHPALQAQQTQTAAAQPTTEQDIQLLRQDLRSQKKQLVAANMPLTDTEAEKFWPVYDQYTQETIKINDSRWAVIKQYAAEYQTLTDDQAHTLIQQWIQSDADAAQLRLKYIPIFEKVIPAKKTALFMQLDRRVGLLMDVQLASQVPLVQQ